MTRTGCLGRGNLVGVDWWLPIEPFDFCWGMFGCNHLLCRTCGQQVRSSAAEYHRLYECACRSREEAGIHMLGEDEGRDRAFENAWYCGGHPSLLLPTTLDGVEISELGAFSSIVSQTLENPPFVAPGFKRRSFWVERLYHLMPSDVQRGQIGRDVLLQLSSEEPRQVAAALSFFSNIPRAPGAEELPSIARRDRSRLRAMEGPLNRKGSLYDEMLDALRARANASEREEQREDALSVLQAAALRGEADSLLIVSLSHMIPGWLCEHAAELVQARPDVQDTVRYALREGFASKLEEAAAALQSLEAFATEAREPKT